MVGVAINSQGFRLFVADNAADVFLYLLSVFFGDEVLPAFYGKNNLNIYLGIGIGHCFWVALLRMLQRLRSYGAFGLCCLVCSTKVVLLRSYGCWFYVHVFVATNIALLWSFRLCCILVLIHAFVPHFN